MVKKFTISLEQFDFSDLIFKSTSRITKIETASEASKLRRDLIATFQGAEFQSRYRELAENICRTHYGEPVYVQSVPTPRVVLPNALATSWHTDNWYGHSEVSDTFWIPLVSVFPGAGINFVQDNAQALSTLEEGLKDGAISLEEINNYCALSASEYLAQPGECLKFGARELHGSPINCSNKLRISFDFRIVPTSASLGNKRVDNYFRCSPDGTDFIIKKLRSDRRNARGVKYINGACAVSTKSQHIMMESYAEQTGLQLDRNEAEIEIEGAAPVLMAYAARQVPDPDAYDFVMLFSKALLPKDQAVRRKILEAAKANEVELMFVAEDQVFPGSESLEEVLEFSAERAA